MHPNRPRSTSLHHQLSTGQQGKGRRRLSWIDLMPLRQPLSMSPTPSPIKAPHLSLSLSRGIRCLFLVYLTLSVLYTFLHFYLLLFPGSSGSGQGTAALNATAATVPLRSAHPAASFRDQTVVGQLLLDEAALASRQSTMDKSEEELWMQHDQHWPEDDGVPRSWTGRYSIVTEADKDPLYSVPSDLLYSKLFQYALKPSKIIPYFYRKQARVQEDLDITITTMITIERLGVFRNLVERYKGPVSLTLHIKDDENKAQSLQSLHQVHRESREFAQFVDVHLIVDNYDRQFNLWRNVARLYATTQLIMTMDVDFMLCSDLQRNIGELPQVYKEMVSNGSAVFVVPAFEFVREVVEIQAVDYPKDKDQLMAFMQRKEVIMFHNSWKRGHGPTNYAAWSRAQEPYRVQEYNYNYEPYVLMKRDGLPWCDERFVGYGANKAACLYEIYLSGVQFWVLPFDFLIHQRHPYPENDRRVERRYNRRLYDAYREEVCFRYSRMAEGVPNSTYIDERICGINFPNYFGL